MPGLADLLSETKRDLLLLMKRRGAISLNDAEEASGLTRTTLREHFSQFERDGLVERSTVRQGRGRPSLRYRLTEAGHGLFPSRDRVLLGGLLEFLQERGEDRLIQEFFVHFWAERRREFQHRLSHVGDDDLEGRLKILEHVLQEQGFMPQIRSNEDGFEIRECNCPFPEAVRHTRLPCRLEAEFFRDLFQKQIDRVTYIPDGSPACTYTSAGELEPT